ncbi:MAG: glycosyltransferase family 2 protein [Pseudomonadota bacterium]
MDTDTWQFRPADLRTAVERKRISLVVPVLNEEGQIDAFLDELAEPVEQLGRLLGHPEPVEIIFVDDGSTDATAALIANRLTARDDLRLVRLSRNFGKDPALAAGLAAARGDAVIPIDVDLQDPPEVIPNMVAAWLAGAKVVNAKRITRETDSYLKRRSAELFYRIYNKLARDPIPENVGDFRLLDREVVDTLNRFPERIRFMKGLFAWIGYRQETVHYDRAERSSGESKWRFWSLWNFALDGITGSSTVPLRIWTYFGIVLALGALCYAAVLVAKTLIYGIDAPGYASLMVVTLVLGAFNMISIGILGEYIGRISVEVRRRPLYIVEDTLGFDTKNDGTA